MTLKQIKFRKKKYYENRKNFIDFIYRLHNRVNNKIGKPKENVNTLYIYEDMYRAI